MSDNVDSGLTALIKLELQPFNKIYFNSKMNTELPPSGDIQKIYLFSIIAALVLLIARMGIFGLTSLYDRAEIQSEQNTEKYLVSSSSQIVFALTNNFLKWGFCFKSSAIPSASFVMQKWLNNFSHRTDLAAWIFFLAAGLSMLIAFITMCFQSYRAAIGDPVVTLK